MKKFTLSLLVVCLAAQIQAQTVTIPNVNFKNALIAAGVDTNSDSIIQVSEALAVTRLTVHGSVNAVSKKISDLTGIGAFTNLTYLSCDTNSLTTLDLHTNVLLDTLLCNGNQIASLDLTPLTALKRVNCSTNQLTSINTSMNTALEWFDIGATQIVTLDLSNNVALTYIDIVFCTSLTSLDVSKCVNMASILAIQTSQLTHLDVSMNNALTSLNTVNLFGTGGVKTICVNSAQLASHPGWTKKSSDTYNTTNCLVGIDEISKIALPKKLMAIYNLFGQEVNIDDAPEGIYIYQYNDGSVKKVSRF